MGLGPHPATDALATAGDEQDQVSASGPASFGRTLCGRLVADTSRVRHRRVRVPDEEVIR